MATKEQLRKLRQKHHLGEYRIKNTRAITVAKRKRFSSVRRSFRRFRKSSVKTSNLKTLALMGVGAGVGSTASMLVRQNVPQVNALPNILGLDLVELGLGFLAYKYGHKLPAGKFVTPIGAGMVIDAIGNTVGSLVGNFNTGSSSGIPLY
jgi:hypothetical protein